MRNKTIDVAKGLGILLVLLGHTDGRPLLLMKFIYSFHMPLFFFVSGYLFNTERFQDFRIGEFIRFKGRRYILPYFAFAFTFYFIFVVFKQVVVGLSGVPLTEVVRPLLKYFVGIFYSRGTADWLPVSSPLWFLTALFMTELYFFVIRKLTRSQVTHFLVVGLLAFAGYFASISLSFKIPWNADTALTSVAFFYIGNRFRLDDFASKPIHLGTLAIALLINLVSVHFNSIIVSFDDNRYGDGVLMYAGALAGILMIFFLAQHFSKSRFLSFFGQHTIIVMGLNFAVLRLVNGLFARVGLANWVLSFMLQVVIMSLLIWGLKRLPFLYRLYGGRVAG